MSKSPTAEIAADRDLLADLLTPYSHHVTIVDGALVATNGHGAVVATGYDDVVELSTALSYAGVIEDDNAFRAAFRDNEACEYGEDEEAYDAGRDGLELEVA